MFGYYFRVLYSVVFNWRLVYIHVLKITKMIETRVSEIVLRLAPEFKSQTDKHLAQ